MTTVQVVDRRNNVTVDSDAVTVVSVGTQGPQGPAGEDGVILSRFKNGQTVTPSPNGVITQFTAPEAFEAGTLEVYLGSSGEPYARIFDFVENSDTQFTFTTDTPPLAVESIRICYIKKV
jgi:hypothetical protein